MTTEMPAIRVDRLTRRFGNITAVDAVSFDVPRGQLFGLLGPKCAGKTTLVRMLTTLLAHTQGQACVAGYEVLRAERRVRRCVGVIPQALTSGLDLTGW